MIDINNILTQALAAAVAEATKPLVERIAALETRLLALENNPAQGVDTTLETRVAALERALDEHNENASHFDEDDVQSWIDNAIENHEGDCTHGDRNDIEQIVEKLLNRASIRISV